MNIIIGIVCILGGIAFLLWDVKTRRKQRLNPFDKVMFARGIIGGIGLMLIGVLSLMGWFE